MSMIISIDVETDGLYGPPIAIAAILEGSSVFSTFTWAADVLVNDPWVWKNVIPHTRKIKNRFASVPEMLNDFWEWFQERKEGTTIIAHMPYPVEFSLFRACVELDPEQRQWKGPMHIHDVGTLLLQAGENPSSVDAYAQKHNLPLRYPKQEHDPRSDADVALTVWLHLCKQF